MAQLRVRAVLARGGTSKGLIFHRRDLPAERAAWDALFLAAMGSPDPNGRQLDGVGGGISSLSKCCVVGPPSRAEADVDFTFAQVEVRRAAVDYRSNCGNMLAAIGPFAVDEGLVSAAGGEARVRIHNTNTGKRIEACFPLEGGCAAVEGDLAIPGVAGTGAPVRLEFLDPGGAATGALLPSGRPLDRLQIPGLGPIDASLVDAGNPCVFVAAAALGLEGNEPPEAIDADPALGERLERIRCAAGVVMGLAASPEALHRGSPAIPKLGLVAPPRAATTLSGGRLEAGDGALSVRMLSMGNAHRALPLTGALCCAVAARIEGTVVARNAVLDPDPEADLRLLQPSGVLAVRAVVTRRGGTWHAERASFYRTQRRLLEGFVCLPRSRCTVP